MKAKDFFKILNPKILKIIGKIIDLLTNAVSLSKKIISRKEQKEMKKKISKENKEIEDICDHGSLDDLLDKFIKVTIFSMLLLPLHGCYTDLSIVTTNSWEGHYMNEKEFYEHTQGIKLNKNESIWVISNSTLKRILKEKAN